MHLTIKWGFRVLILEEKLANKIIYGQLKVRPEDLHAHVLHFSTITYQLDPFFMLMYTFHGYSWGKVSSPPKIFEAWLARPQSQVGSGPLNI